jgi:predicted RNA binding protein YcfA (HicA-like mRNA interferase family)
MPKIPAMRSKEFLRQLKRFGCEELRISGSHHRIRYPKTGEESTVAVHGSDEHKKSMLHATLQQLGIDVDEFLEFIA